MVKKYLNISNNLKLPLDSVTQTFAILAMKRVGKTYTASVMAEEMVKAGLPFVVLDPTGAWWGLRASLDGKSEGLPVVIIGGEHGDVPLESTAGKVIADLVVDRPGFYIVDLSSTESNAAQDRFAMDFAERLYRRKNEQRSPLHLFIDEADSFAPQRPMDGQQRMLGAFEALVRRGGVRGIGMTMITQRPAVLNKNVLTQAEVLIVLRMNAPQDQKAIDEWVQKNGTKEQRDEMMASLASLKKGQAWVWSPSWLECFKLVQIRERQTFNSSATPRAGEKVIEPHKLAPVDLTHLSKQIQETIERAKADDPKELKRQIAELKRQQSVPVKQVETKTVIEKVNVPFFQKGELENLLYEMERHGKEVLAQAGQLKEALNALVVMQSQSDAKYKASSVQTTNIPDMQFRTMTLPRGGASSPYQQSGIGVVTQPSPNQPKDTLRLRSGERLMLTVLKQFNRPMSNSQLRMLAGHGFSAKSFDTYKGILKNNGLVCEQSDMLELTETGSTYIGEVDAVPTEPNQLFEFWSKRLRKGEQTLLRYGIENYPQWTRLADVRPYLPELSDQSFRTYLSILRTQGLIELGDNQYRASESFFMGA